jgi:hypothetical protein
LRVPSMIDKEFTHQVPHRFLELLFGMKAT